MRRRARSKAQLVAAYKRLEKREHAIYREQDELMQESAKHCPLKFGQIIEVHSGRGRKRWGEVASLRGIVGSVRAGWRAIVKNTRKNGDWIGGEFLIDDNGSLSWTVIKDVK